jgi:hypothetical protein
VGVWKQVEKVEVEDGFFQLPTSIYLTSIQTRPHFQFIVEFFLVICYII